MPLTKEEIVEEFRELDRQASVMAEVQSLLHQARDVICDEAEKRIERKGALLKQLEAMLPEK